MATWALAVLLAAAAWAGAAAGADLEVLYQWNYLTYALPKDFPADGYIPENNVFTGLEAYPDWRWHSAEANCSGLISVYRVRADRCDRLWVLDAGLVDSLGSYTPVCAPKLLTFDLRTDRLVRSVTFPSDVRRLQSLFTNLVLDEAPGGGCDDLFIYITDTAAPGLVVYDVQRDATWRLNHASFWPHPDWSTYESSGRTLTGAPVRYANHVPSGMLFRPRFSHAFPIEVAFWPYPDWSTYEIKPVVSQQLLYTHRQRNSQYHCGLGGCRPAGGRVERSVLHHVDRGGQQRGEQGGAREVALRHFDLSLPRGAARVARCARVAQCVAVQAGRGCYIARGRGAAAAAQAAAARAAHGHLDR
ncbi:Uncharacterized protein GBIM_09948 [Gryllus bimaculatus]|nr:Uncharacterized protein GBIM_09948 [Gryllus bimaculatus]